MATPVVIESPEQFTTLLSSSRIVVTDFHATWCAPCHQIAPLYEQLSARLSRPNQITFTKVDVDQQKEIARAYEISAMPTFMIFKNGNVVSKILGADPGKLSKAIQQLAAEAESKGSSSGTGSPFDTTPSGGGLSSDAALWLGTEIPKGYNDVTDKVEIKGVDLLNVDSGMGSARVLFDSKKPSGVALLESGKGKGKEKASTSTATTDEVDWVESDTDQQMMLFMPFTSSLKVHSLHLTSLPPRRATSSGEEERSEENVDQSTLPTRPKTVNVYSNRAHVLGFEEAEDIPATQSITLSPQDWDEKTGTAKVELRYVKFQNVTSLVVFVVDGEDDDAEKVRLDRVRIVGEAGKERNMGKLEKIGDEPGE
ncbi:MAG: Aminopeptidase 2 mitochondrial [Watsoniomyces obsoletus]|nr:MAG: Aminopeptidase 2 mitochondrial [Watsoniomyces obsoletus]